MNIGLYIHVDAYNSWADLIKFVRVTGVYQCKHAVLHAGKTFKRIPISISCQQHSTPEICVRFLQESETRLHAHISIHRIISPTTPIKFHQSNGECFNLKLSMPTCDVKFIIIDVIKLAFALD